MTRQQHPRRVPPNQQAPPPPYPTQQQAPPPPPPYPCQPQQQAPAPPQVVQVHEQHVIIPIHNRFRDAPQHAHCLNCNRDVVTEIHFQAGLLTWLLFGAMFLTGLWLCCFIPFCIEDCQDCEHYCPNCKNIIGTYKRI